MVARSDTTNVLYTPTGGATETSVGFFDVSEWSTCEFRAQRNPVGGPSDREFNTAAFRWYPDPRGSEPPSHPIQFRWMTDIPLSVEFPHHGGVMEFLLTATADNSPIQYTMAHTTREVTEPRAMNATGLILNGAWNVNPGQTFPADQVAHGILTPGPVTLYLGAPTQKGEFRINAGTDPLVDIVVDPSVKGEVITIESPRASLSVPSVINRGTVAAGFSARATAGRC